jgi:hypothetical protein
MLVGVYYFPTDYGIDITELARALKTGASSHCSCASTLIFR